MVNLSMENLDTPNVNQNLDPAPPAPQQEEVEMFEDTQSTPSTPSSAGALNMTQIENKLETEMVKIARMVKDSISSLTTQLEQDRAEMRGEINRKISNLNTGIISSRSLGSNAQSSISQTNQNNSAVQPNQSNSTADYFSKPFTIQGR